MHPLVGMLERVAEVREPLLLQFRQARRAASDIESTEAVRGENRAVCRTDAVLYVVNRAKVRTDLKTAARPMVEELGAGGVILP